MRQVNLHLEFALVSFLFVLGCKGYSFDEVARVTSPDGAVDAILFETNGGATTSFGYVVEVAPPRSIYGARVANLYGAVRNDQAYGVNLEWLANDRLAVEYLRAKQERIEVRRVQIAGREIEVVLRSNLNDPDAPAGGMLYNIHKH